MRKIITVIILLSSNYLFAQNVEIQGVVTSEEDGQGLPGVTILEDGTTNGTISDADGNFSIVVNADATLTFSFVGFLTQNIPVSGRTRIDLVMELDVASLEEVVVIGYATQKKETLVSSVSTVQGEELQKSPQPNLSNSFAGRVSGVIATTSSGEPGFDGSQLLIRGQTSNGDNSPLIVVDGVISQLG
ncbi:MAG: carboxypeptidase-like regulatory domain-containing protein, partial [Bacteroidota bacterium]